MKWELNKAYPILYMKNECLLNFLGWSSWNIWITVILVIFPLFKRIRPRIRIIITYIKRTQVSNFEYWKYNVLKILQEDHFISYALLLIISRTWEGLSPLGCNFVSLWDGNRSFRKCIQTQLSSWKMISFRPLFLNCLLHLFMQCFDHTFTCVWFTHINI